MAAQATRGAAQAKPQTVAAEMALLMAAQAHTPTQAAVALPAVA